MKPCSACLAAFVLAIIGVGDARAESVAIVIEVVSDVYRRPPGRDERPARPGDQLVQDEVLRTGAGSSIHIRFADGSELSLEPESEVVLSSRVLDGPAGAAAIDLADGLFQLDAQDSGRRGAARQPDRQDR
jgi:hypothetical protein